MGVFLIGILISLVGAFQPGLQGTHKGRLDIRWRTAKRDFLDLSVKAVAESTYQQQQLLDEESPRLTKAKRLLQEFTLTDEEASSSLTGVSTATAATNNKKIFSDDESNNIGSNTTVVPDTFWRNDHLLQQGSGSDDSRLVTRWARGVKVAEPLVKYDPVAAEKLLFRQPTKWLVRNFQIAIPLGLWATGVVLDFVTGRSKPNRRERAKQLTRAITDLGPAIIKGGQALSSRPDLLPSEYLEELQKLQDEVPTFSSRVALATVEEELGCDFSDVFELVQEEPVAAASIGQVYKARLVANGDLVALKIQRPGCEEIIALDLYVLRWWCGVYNQIFQILNRDVDLQTIIDDFGELIYREIDYVAEAANAQRFSELYADSADVFVPKIYSDLTTSKVLTMEWVDGVRLTDKAALTKYGLDDSKLVDTLVECSMKQILSAYLSSFWQLVSPECLDTGNNRHSTFSFPAYSYLLRREWFFSCRSARW